MLSIIFSHISYFYLLLLVIATGVILMNKPGEGRFWPACVLWGLFIPAQSGAWYYPDIMAVIHFCVYSLGLLLLEQNANDKYLKISMLAMIASDVFFAVAANPTLTRQQMFIWQSSINIIFATQCIITIVINIKRIRSDKKNAGSIEGNENLMARISGIH